MERISNISYGLCRSWLLLLGYCCFCLVSNKNRIGVEGSHTVYPEFQFINKTFVDQNVSAKGKPSYHFRPRQYWINDPNGPMYYNGMYHLFYQHNPNGSVWNSGIIWAHAVSKDLINWSPKRPAIYPTKPYDQNGCWSGSATVVPGKGPVLFYTGVDHQNREVQSYAVPANLSDPELQVWLKPDNNPLINAPAVGDHINASAIRDPTTAWLRNGQWEMLVGTRWNRRGIAALYKSRDLMKWTLAGQPLHSVDGTGMWECPDFFPVLRDGSRSGLDTSSHGDHVKHVLKVSLDETRYDYYTVGRYDVASDRYVPDNGSVDGRDGLRYDYGNFYASKSFFDGAKGRRVVWGWANESDMAADDVEKGWAGVMPMPRTVWLDRGGKQLLLWPVEEVETLRAKKVEMRQRPLTKGQVVEIKGITAAQADVEVVFSLGSLQKAERLDRKWAHNGQALCGEQGSKVVGGIGPFGLLTLASEDLQEFTPVFFRIFKAADEEDKHVVLMCSDATSSSLGDNLYRPSFAGFVDADLSDGKLSLRSLIDHSIVESFGEGGKTCITSRVYPTKALRGDAHLYAFNNGSSTVTVQQLTAWSIREPVMAN